MSPRRPPATEGSSKGRETREPRGGGDGMWRSQAARWSGGPEGPGSNPGIPTTTTTIKPRWSSQVQDAALSRRRSPVRVRHGVLMEMWQSSADCADQTYKIYKIYEITHGDVAESG